MSDEGYIRKRQQSMQDNEQRLLDNLERRKAEGKQGQLPQEVFSDVILDLIAEVIQLPNHTRDGITLHLSRGKLVQVECKYYPIGFKKGGDA